MSYQEKRSLVSLIGTILVLGLYGLYVYHKYQDVILIMNNDFRFWGKAFFILIPVMIVAQIIIQIVFTIINKIVTNEDMPTFSDERDKLIELKAIRISHWVFTLGFLLSMGTQAIGMQPWVMFITLVVSGFLAACTTEIIKIYLYRKGF
jgi:hypothetical protein